MTNFSSIEALLASQPATPPIEKWHPAFSGEMDMLIKSDGTWVHEGSPIKREKLVALFASILRREGDGCYYLVTPVEKWRIQVEQHPLIITDVDFADDSSDKVIVVTNVGRRYLLGDKYPLRVDHVEGNEVPVVDLDYGLSAKFNRPTFYRLVEHCQQCNDEIGFISDGHWFAVGAD
jgi:hypothetical protein